MSNEQADKQDSLKARVQEILLAVVNDKEPYRNEAGFTRWGRIQADINAAIDVAFVPSSIERIDAEPPQPSLYDRRREETLKLAREVLGCSIPDGEGRQGILWAKRFANELISTPSAIERRPDYHDGLIEECAQVSAAAIRAIRFSAPAANGAISFTIPCEPRREEPCVPDIHPSAGGGRICRTCTGFGVDGQPLRCVRTGKNADESGDAFHDIHGEGQKP